jgi:hypothetical protein
MHAHNSCRRQRSVYSGAPSTRPPAGDLRPRRAGPSDVRPADRASPMAADESLEGHSLPALEDSHKFRRRAALQTRQTRLSGQEIPRRATSIV